MQKNEEFRSMSKSMGTVMIFMMLSKVVGMARETELSSRFGMDWVTDAYKVALNIPNLILTVVITAIAAVFIPVYNSRLEKGEADARRFVNNLYTVGLILTTAITILTFFLLEWLVSMFMSVEEVRPLTLRLAQIMMPMTFFTFLHRLTTSYLQAKFRFTLPAVATLFFNVFVVAGIALSRENIHVVAVATLVGTAAQFFIQLPQARRAGLDYRPVVDWKDPGFKSMFVLMVPVLVASCFDQLYTSVITMVVSGVEGHFSALDYANRINTLVSAVLLVTIATVLYPSLVRDAKDPKAYAGHLALGINLNLLVAIPAAAAMVLLRVPIIRLVYERNSFTAEHTVVVSGLLACYALSLLGAGIREMCTRGFYALEEVKTPTLLSIAGVVLFIILSYALYAVWGVNGVALATAISFSAIALAMYVMLQRRMKDVGQRRVAVCLGKTSVATAAMCLMLWLCTRAFSLTTVGGMRLLVLMGGVMVAGLLVYLGVLLLLRTEELRMVLELFRKRRKGAQSEDTSI